MQNAIVTAADAKYLPAACCALISCMGDGEVGASAKLFLLACGGVSAGEAEKARDFLESRGASVEIIVIGPDRFHPFRIDSYVSAATYSRLLLTQFFDDRWDRLLYLDADMRVMAPLQPLLEISLRGRPLGAVHDYLRYIIYGMKESRGRLSLRSDAPYFNAGLICFDWSATLASKLLQRAQAFAANSAHLCRSHDQDALNKAFEGEWLPLDPRWNLMAVAVPDDVLRLEYPVRIRPYISHFAGQLKPWMENFPERFGPHRAWYHELLRESPWPDFAALACAPLGPRPQGDHRRDSSLSKLRRLRAAFQRLWRPKEDGLFRISGLLELENGESHPGLERLFDAMIAQAARPGMQQAG